MVAILSLCMRNLGHTFIFIEELLRIIAVLAQSPAVLMFVDITGAPKHKWKYVET